MDVERAFAEHHEALRRYLVRYTGDREEAADAVQEAYLRLLQQPPDHAAAVRTWLFRVATNVVRDRWKGREIRRRLAQQAAHQPLDDAPPDPHETLERRERQREAHRMLAVLSAREQAIVLMREEGFMHREIAEAVGTTTGSIGTMLARALRKLARVSAHRAEDLL